MMVSEGDLRLSKDMIGEDEVVRYKVERLHRFEWVSIFQCATFAEAEAFSKGAVRCKSSVTICYYTKDGRKDV
jgi:hypothetical protein